jgi:hypothetical protein
MMGIPIEFRVGHWYQLVKPIPYDPHQYGDMAYACDGKPQFCTYSSCGGTAQFAGQEGTQWSYPMDCFSEVPAPGKKEDMASLNCRCSTSPITINYSDGSSRTFDGFSEPKKVSSKAQRRSEILARLKIE